MKIKKRKKKSKKLRLYIGIMVLFTCGLTIAYAAYIFTPTINMTFTGTREEPLPPIDEELNLTLLLLTSPDYIEEIDSHRGLEFRRDSYSIDDSSLDTWYIIEKSVNQFITLQVRIGFRNDYGYTLTNGQIVSVTTNIPATQYTSINSTLDTASLTDGSTAYIDFYITVKTKGLDEVIYASYVTIQYDADDGENPVTTKEMTWTILFDGAIMGI